MSNGPARRGRERSSASAIMDGTYYLLDMGDEQYGDSILCLFGDKTVLIDAGHPSDFDGQEGYESIPEQLEQILGTKPPFKLTLLVITHGHNDHIGCLPKMVEAGMLQPEFALVADPDLGFPPGFRDAMDVSAGLDSAAALAVSRAVAGLLEEDHSFLSDTELDAFLDAAMKLGGRYRQALDALADSGTKIFKWGSTDPQQLTPIYQALAGTGFDVIGPSLPHLEICRDQIIAYSKRKRDEIADLVHETKTATPDSPTSAASLYRAALAGASDVLIDMKGQGSALNCQSIVLKFGPDDRKVLLAADMQFAVSEVDDLDQEMADLKRKVVAAGPYRFVKTTHHTSYNGLGQDADFWQELGKPPLLVHSGGLNDDKHPDRTALKMLKDLSESIVFARTDRNGRVVVDPRKDDEHAIEVARGDLNDFRANPRRRRRDETLPMASEPTTPTPAASVQAAPEGKFVDLLFVRIPYEDGRVSVDGRVIEISGRGGVVRAPSGDIRRAPPPVRPAVERPRPSGSGKLGSDGRDLSKLLFVTHSAKLAKNVGAAEAEQALKMVSGAAQCIKIDSIGQPEAAIRQELARGKHKGVVIVGGYDVVPCQRVDVLDPPLRALIPNGAIREDKDEFIVWSDDVWGDIEGRGMPDLPVSRIPDGRSAELLLKALQAKNPLSASGRFGIRNTLRPFATRIFTTLPGNEDLLESAPTRYDQIGAGSAQRPFIYFMLHGLDQDGSRFWGDDPGRGTVVEAVNTASLPTGGLGVALAGCCWGALTVDQRAKDRSVLSPKTTEGSMALSVLMGGALAFVGCTGIHYSPDAAGGFFGGPMHLAFWQQLINNRRPPAEALFEARRDFLAAMPHGRRLPLELGIERKIYKQFTCLGLGW
jgi:beta-lactamase superfamily II metal-dependent hydrolase